MSLLAVILIGVAVAWFMLVTAALAERAKEISEALQRIAAGYDEALKKEET